ncbi:MAG: transporter substrate-binding domain-containing protein [Clostridia bacterium]
MKKIITIVAIVLLVACLSISMVACGSSDLKVGKTFVEADAQVKILTELKSNTADIGVMDSVMAGYYMKTEGASDLQLIEGCVLADENYGIAGRKGSGIINAINKAMVELELSGDITTVATAYGLQNEIAVDTTKTYAVDADNADYKAIMNNGKLIVGYTEFAPIAYKDTEGKLIGFDTDLAKKVAAKLGLDIEFIEIVWETKEIELRTNKIDLIWNGLTITDERSSSMEMSAPYMKNKQVAVIRKTDATKYTKDTATWNNATMIAEAGSAGAACIEKEKD